MKARREALRHFAELPDDEPRTVLATGRYISEGFNDPGWARCYSRSVRLRGHLGPNTLVASPYPSVARIYDYVDGDVPVLRRKYAERVAPPEDGLLDRHPAGAGGITARDIG